MYRISMAKTSAAFFSSSLVKKSGAGSFWSAHHHFTTCASRPNSSRLSECRMQTTLRSECASRKSPRAAEPNKITHSKFAAANSFSLRTNSASFVSVDCISNPFLSNGATSFPKLLRLRCCRRQTPQTRLLLRHRRSRLRPSLPHPSPGRSCLPAVPAETRDTPSRPLRVHPGPLGVPVDRLQKSQQG